MIDALPLCNVTPEIMERYASIPVIAWMHDFSGYLSLAGEAPFTSLDPAAAQRLTLATAFFRLRGKDVTLQPIDFVTLDFPMPPSTNNLFLNTKAKAAKGGPPRVKTPAYRAWLTQATYAIKPQLTAQGAPPAPLSPLFGEHWAIMIRVNMDHCGDVTNRIKALEDLLVSWNVTCGDQWNDRCTVERDRTLTAACRAIIYRIVQPATA